jgi:hypothetical protein
MNADERRATPAGAALPCLALDLLSQDDFTDNLRLEACGSWLISYEVHAGAEAADVIRAGFQVCHLATVERE